MSESSSNSTDLKQEAPKKKPVLSKDQERLAGCRPLKTLLKLSVGPLLSQITGAFYGIVTTLWVSKAIGTNGMSAISLMNSFDGLGRAFGFFIGTSGSSQISYLIGQRKLDETGQLIADYIRISIILGIIVAAILLPCLKPAARWFGANKETIEMGFQYMLPLCICIFSTCFFLGVGGCLQGEGRSFFFGIVNLIAIVCNMLILNPLFLFGFKTGIVGAGLSNAIAEAVPGFILIFLYFRGKFFVKPKFNMLFKKFSPYTISSLKVGVSQLVSNLSLSLPSILIRKFLGNKTKENFDDVMAAFNVGVRICQLCNAVLIAVTAGYLPAGSYAYAAKLYKRLVRLFLHSLWLNLSWAAFISIFSWAIPKQIGTLFSSSNRNYLKYCKELIRALSGFTIFQAFRYNCQTFLQSLQKGVTATILSFINNFVATCGFAFIFYYWHSNNEVLVAYSFAASYIFSMVLSICVIARPFFRILKKAKNSQINEVNEPNERELEDVSKSNDDSDDTSESVNRDIET